jgi:hypothetical protein
MTIILKDVIETKTEGNDVLLRAYEIVYVPKTIIGIKKKFLEQYLDEQILISKYIDCS